MDLRINYQETKSTGRQVTSKGEEFSTLLRQITSINNELQSYWEGQDASKYSNSVNEQAQTMQKLAEKIDEIGAFLVKVGEAYEQAASDNASAIR